MRTFRRVISYIALIWLLAVCMTVALATEETYSGTCGEGLQWSLSGGVLTVSGTGEMTDYTEFDPAPWWEFRQDIRSVTISEGVTSVGDLTFYDCQSLTGVTLPDSLRSIGEIAFAQCTALTNVYSGNGLEIIGRSAFEECTGLQDFAFPAALTTLGERAFYRCAALRSVTLPENATDLGYGAFAYCTSLVQATIRGSITVLPDWIFYGCDSLSTLVLPESLEALGDYAVKGCTRLQDIHYPNAWDNGDTIQDQVSEQEPECSGSVTGREPSDSSETQTPEGEQVEVTENDDAVITVTTLDKEVRIVATVRTAEGWNILSEKVDANYHRNTEMYLDVAYASNNAPKKDVLDHWKEMSLVLTLRPSGGAVSTVTLPQSDSKGDWNLDYILEPDPEVPEGKEWDSSYTLTFPGKTEADADVTISLGKEHARETVSLYQNDTLLQSVLADADGNVTFHISGIGGSFTLAINDPEAVEPEIPTGLVEEYGGQITQLNDVEYVITGVKSSWNMGLGKVMLILAAVLVGSFVLIGIVMTTLNRRAQKKMRTQNRNRT